MSDPTEDKEQERRDKQTFCCVLCLSHYLGEDMFFYDNDAAICYKCHKELRSKPQIDE